MGVETQVDDTFEEAMLRWGNRIVVNLGKII
jgi:hypothetical protein